MRQAPTELHPTTPTYRAVVRNKRPLTPSVTRITLHSHELTQLPHLTAADSYVKMLFPRPECPNIDLRTFCPRTTNIQRRFWPVVRPYTISCASRNEISFDFAHHGPFGVANLWAECARPGHELMFRGPYGNYYPSPDAAWHLLVGDITSLPALTRAYEEISPHHKTAAFVEIDHRKDVIHLRNYANKSITWLLRDGRPRGSTLTHAINKLNFHTAQPQCFVHGEANLVRRVQNTLCARHKVSPENISAVGYWRAGQNEDEWTETQTEFFSSPQSHQLHQSSPRVA